MKQREPLNETYLAVEIWAANARCGLSMYRAAGIAANLCVLGRAWTKGAERLCGGEETWGRYPEAEKRIARAQKLQGTLILNVKALLQGIPGSYLDDNEGGSLHLAVTSRVKGVKHTTVLK
jgi:hypothetical protein